MTETTASVPKVFTAVLLTIGKTWKGLSVQQ